ncbi:hypothetical protein KCP74_04155 [Salmonella enterica subsp. enterica]|nr:hypothetical protein KCP74_04155 [Salmonella enterica subsp. enterica]
MREKLYGLAQAPDGATLIRPTGCRNRVGRISASRHPATSDLFLEVIANLFILNVFGSLSARFFLPSQHNISESGDEKVGAWDSHYCWRQPKHLPGKGYSVT